MKVFYGFIGRRLSIFDDMYEHIDKSCGIKGYDIMVVGVGIVLGIGDSGSDLRSTF